MFYDWVPVNLTFHNEQYTHLNKVLNTIAVCGKFWIRLFLVVMQMHATSQSVLSRHGLVLYDPQKSPSSFESESVRTLAEFEETLFKLTPVTP